MRYLLLSLVALLLAVPSQAQDAVGTWTLLENSPFHNYRFEDGSFIDPETGWIVDGWGRTFHTTDGGETWTPHTGDPLPGYLRTTAFIDAQHGFIGTLSRPELLFETTDGGVTFTDVSDRISGEIPTGICGMWVVNEDVIYAVGRYDGPAYFLKTTDGGQTWNSTNLADQVGSLVDVFFWDEQRGLILGGSNATNPGTRAVVLMTEDGGETWTERFQSSDDGEWGWKLTFPTPMIGYASVEDWDWDTPPAKVMKTTDGGMTWDEIIIENSDPLQGLGFISENVGWSSGRGVTSVTADGGDTWEQITLDGDINRFEFFGDTLGYAMGHQIYKYELNRGTSNEERAPTSALAITTSFPNPFTTGTTIRYQTAEASDVDLAVYDLLGRRVATLARGVRPGGEHEATWSGTASDGRSLASGIYIVQLRAEGKAVSHRLTLLRP